MNKQNYFVSITVVAVFIFLILGCKNLSLDSKSSTSLKSLKITLDENGKNETAEFRVGQKIYANVELDGDTTKSQIIFSVTNSDNSYSLKMKPVELKGNSTVQAWFGSPGLPGKFRVVAELVRDQESRKTTGVTQLSHNIILK